MLEQPQLERAAAASNAAAEDGPATDVDVAPAESLTAWSYGEGDSWEAGHELLEDIAEDSGGSDLKDFYAPEIENTARLAGKSTVGYGTMPQPSEQRLIFAGKQLEISHTLAA